MRVALVNTKGGAGKTTTAVYLAAGLSAHGRTLLVDCDPQQSATAWLAEDDTKPPYGVVALPVEDVDKQLPALAAGYEHVVIDTPPAFVSIISSAVRAADAVLVPVAPTRREMNRLIPTLELLAALDQEKSISTAILLNRMHYSTNSAKAVRTVLNEHGWPVMATEIPARESYAQAAGAVPLDETGAYGDLVKELLT